MSVYQRKFIEAIVLSGCVVASMPAMAFDGTSVDVDTGVDSGGFIGLGVGVTPDYEGSDDYEAVPALFGQYLWSSGRYVEMGGTQGSEQAARLSLNIMSRDWSDFWVLGPLVQYRLERDGVDERQVDSLKKVDDATELGPSLASAPAPGQPNWRLPAMFRMSTMARSFT